jgi:hypothetical protein
MSQRRSARFMSRRPIDPLVPTGRRERGKPWSPGSGKIGPESPKHPRARTRESALAHQDRLHRSSPGSDRGARQPVGRVEITQAQPAPHPAKSHRRSPTTTKSSFRPKARERRATASDSRIVRESGGRHRAHRDRSTSHLRRSEVAPSRPDAGRPNPLVRSPPPRSGKPAERSSGALPLVLSSCNDVGTSPALPNVGGVLQPLSNMPPSTFLRGGGKLDPLFRWWGALREHAKLSVALLDLLGVSFAPRFNLLKGLSDRTPLLSKSMA